MLNAAKAVLFDVDGTLIRAGGAGRKAIAEASAELCGRSLEQATAAVAQIDFRGNTDRLIFEALLTSLGAQATPHDQPTDALTDALAEAYLEHLPAALDACEMTELPGVLQLVRILEQRPQTHVGLLTGNLREGARRKLQRIGLERLCDQAGGFAEDGRQRREIAKVANQRLEALGIKPWGTVVVGDTVHDVTAAHSFGAVGVAVATGWTPEEQLRDCGAQLFLSDLSQPGQLLGLLERL